MFFDDRGVVEGDFEETSSVVVGLQLSLEAACLETALGPRRRAGREAPEVGLELVVAPGV